MNDTNNKMNILLPLYFEGKLDEEQTRKVEAWIAASAENKAIADDMADAYRASDTLFTMNNADTEKALKSVNGRIKRTHMRQILIKVERVAAVLFIPLLMVSMVQLYHAMRPQPASMMSLATSPGMTASATLPDGTVVKLNSDSRLSYPSTFTGDNREISLQGEAYFHVSKDTHHPFIVNTPQQAAVKVYGTHFDVEAYPNDDIVTATLEEGSIAMTYTDSENRSMERRIMPGQAIEYSKTKKDIRVSDTEVDVATSWKDGRLIFRDTPVKEVLRSLAKRYGVEFDVRNQNVYNNSFTGTLERQRLDRILEYLSITSNMHFRYVPNGDISGEKQKIEIY